MLNDLPCGTQVYLVTGYTDLRRSIDGLAAIVQGQLQLDPFCKGLFLFCGRRCDRIKGLLWEGDGFLLLYKRLNSPKLFVTESPAYSIKIQLSKSLHEKVELNLRF